MFRSLFICLSLGSAGASRVHTQSQLDTEFGASCDNLQSRFHNQVQTFRAALDARTSESAVAQARFSMRMLGMVRTLRRAQACDWVAENNSDDIEEMRGIMQELITGNPCAEAARSELDAGVSVEGTEHQMQSILRAMSILMSDDCEVSEIQPADDAHSPEAQLQEVEEEMQDTIDEIMDAEDEGESLIQLDQAGRFQSFMRGVGVFLLMLFLLLACVEAIAIIVMFLAFGLWYVIVALGGLHATAALNSMWASIFIGSGLGSAAGLVGCAYQLYNSVLPRLSPPAVPIS